MRFAFPRNVIVVTIRRSSELVPLRKTNEITLARMKLKLAILTVIIYLTKVRECRRTRFPQSGASTAL